MAADSLTVLHPLECRSGSLRAGLVRGIQVSGRWCVQGAAWSICLGCFLAVLLRLLWKDSLAELAPFFYATPLPLIWSGLVASSLLFFTVRKTRTGLIAAVFAIACWGWWQQNTGLAAGEKAPTAAVRVVFWNAARLQAGWFPVKEQIQRMSSPIMGFVEAGSDPPRDRLRWQREFPDHQCVFFGNGMVLLVEGNVLRTTQGELAKMCYFGQAVLEVEGNPLSIWLIDIHSSPFYSREQALTTLQELTRNSDGEAVLIMGDFNTPSDSVHLNALREEFRNAFEVGGQGHAETWPSPCPVLAIDQVWANQRVAVHRAWQAWSLESDHRAVIAELSFSE